MKILLNFILLNEEKNEEKCVHKLPFWSCVLDTSIELKDEEYARLNKENEYKIEDFKSLLLEMEYNKYSEDVIKDLIIKHQKRPEYFVASDETFMTGSPYKNSSSLVETYYQDTFEFVHRLMVFCGLNSDYKLNLLQLNVIKLIRSLIGIDIIKNESTAGALSVYNKLPSFDVSGNYNSAKGERYITISAIDDLSGYQNLSVQIEILDTDKILHNTLQNLSSDFKYILPAYLENFSKLRISVFGKETGKTIVSKIYEEKFHLFRSFSIGMSVGSGHSKIVRNRYLNKQIEKIDVYDHIDNISNNPKDYFDIEQAYKTIIFGRDKKFLESKYFGNTQEGRTIFMGWMRKILHSAKAVKVVDPYFDNYGLNDFYSCCDTRFQLTIVTTAPKKRQNTKDYVCDTRNFLKNVSGIFPDSKIYYIPKLHDRYLYVDDEREKKLYSISNSWNGTVNKFSMFVQEVPLEVALQIYDEINTYLLDEYLQEMPLVISKKKNKKENYGKKYTKKYIESISKKLELINIDSDVNEVITVTAEFFFTHYYGKNKKEYVRQRVCELLEKFTEQKVNDLIDVTAKKLLTEQKKSFDDESSYMNGESFSLYDTPRKCLERLSNINMWFEMRSYHLKMDYGLAELMNICFQMYPEYTIKSLLKNEEKICIKKTSNEDNDTILKYHVSEYIIQSFLTEYYPFNGKMTEQAWKFIEKTDSSYIRLFFALSIIDKTLYSENDGILSFDDIIEIFIRLKLCQNEIAVVLGRTLSVIILREQSQAKPKVNYYNSIIDYAAKNFYEQGIIDFSFIAFIEPFDMRINNFIDFMNVLERHNKGHDAEYIEKLFLLYALQTNQKLQNKVRTLFGIERKTMESCFYTKIKNDKEPSDIDIKKFINSLPYLGSIFAHNIENNLEFSEFDKIVFSLSADMTLIFKIKFPSKLTLFYYDLLFLLITVYYFRNENSGSQKILDFTSWYLPVCIDCLPNDFNGLGLKIVGLYSEMIPDEKKKLLLNKLTYLPMKALSASTIKEQTAQTIEIFRKYIGHYDIDDYDKSIQLDNFLNIGISLCIRCTDECNGKVKDELLECVIRINEKVKQNIPEEENHILDYGIEYAKTLSKEAKNTFVDSMKDKFFPQVKSLLEG